MACLISASSLLIFSGGGLETSPNYFIAGVATDFDGVQPGNVFGLMDTNPNSGDFANFDPTRLTNFGPYVQFDSGYTADSDNRFGPLVATNDFGDSLVMSDLFDSGTLTITAIPEPSSALFGTVMVAALFVRRRRRSGSAGVGNAVDRHRFARSATALRSVRLC